MNIDDFLTTTDFNKLKKCIPENREEYLKYAQISYNLKLNTSVPMSVHIEPANICNQKCYMCIYPDMKREKKLIDETLVYTAIDECARIGVYALHFFFFGEPFVNKRTIEYMKYAKAKNIPLVSVTTNGTLLTDLDLKDFVASQIDSIHFSFEGMNREKYYSIRGTDDFDLVKSNILKLLQYRNDARSKKPWIAITYVRIDETDEQIESFISEWNPLVDDIHISPQLDNFKDRSDVSKTSDKINSEGIISRDLSNRLPCRQLWQRLCVLSNGDMVPCSQDVDGDLVVGNIRDISIAQAWNSEKLLNLRMQHISNIYNDECICKNCIDWDWGGKSDNRPQLDE